MSQPLDHNNLISAFAVWTREREASKFFLQSVEIAELLALKKKQVTRRARHQAW